MDRIRWTIHVCNSNGHPTGWGSHCTCLMGLFINIDLQIKVLTLNLLKYLVMSHWASDLDHILLEKNKSPWNLTHNLSSQSNLLHASLHLFCPSSSMTMGGSVLPTIKPIFSTCILESISSCFSKILFLLSFMYILSLSHPPLPPSLTVYQSFYLSTVRWTLYLCWFHQLVQQRISMGNNFWNMEKFSFLLKLWQLVTKDLDCYFCCGCCFNHLIPDSSSLSVTAHRVMFIAIIMCMCLVVQLLRPHGL